MRQKIYINAKRDRQYDSRIKHFLKQHWHEAYTYNQVTTRLALDGKEDWKTVMHALQAMVVADPDIIVYEPNAKAAKTHPRRNLRLYKYAPERKRIDQQPEQADEIVRGLICRYLESHGPQGLAQLREALRTILGHVGNAIVDRSLDKLRQMGTVAHERQGDGLPHLHWLSECDGDSTITTDR